MCQNKWYSKLPWDIVSSVPQRSILGLILYKFFLNDFVYFIFLATTHNFADDSAFASVLKTIDELIACLEFECEVTLIWFNENKVTVNPGKIQAIIKDHYRYK